jgi:hypothetical protein
MVCKALYSMPREYRKKRLRARADSRTVRFYFQGELVETAPRRPPGAKHINPAHFPEEKLACAQRDTAFLRRQAATHGPAVARFADALLAVDLPWTRMRLVYALLGLCRRYGDARVDETCARALAADMHDYHRLRRMLEQATPAAPSGSIRGNVVPLAKYLRPASQYALPLTEREAPNNQGDK